MLWFVIVAAAESLSFFSIDYVANMGRAMYLASFDDMLLLAVSSLNINGVVGPLFKTRPPTVGPCMSKGLCWIR